MNERESPEQREDATEEAVLLLKPGAGSYEDRLRVFLDEHAFEVVSRDERVFDEQTLREFYPHGQEYIEDMKPYFSQEPTVALVVRGSNVLETCLRLKKHIRGMFKLMPPADMLHSSDSVSEAAREKEVLFP